MNRFGTTFRFLIWILFLLGGAVAGIYGDLTYCPFLFKNTLFHAVSFVIGWLLLRLVMRASRNTGRFLARHGKEGTIPKFETNRLVTHGYYGCMRHPMHFGLLFFPLAWAFLLGSCTFIAIIAPLEMVIMILMVKFLEEKEALQKFGKAYREYKKQVPFFSLKRECLKTLFSKQGLDSKTFGIAEKASKGGKS